MLHGIAQRSARPGYTAPKSRVGACGWQPMRATMSSVKRYQVCSAHTLRCRMHVVSYRTTSSAMAAYILPCLWSMTIVAHVGGHSNCVPEEDGSVLVRDDLDALLQVRHGLCFRVCASIAACCNRLSDWIDAAFVYPHLDVSLRRLFQTVLIRSRTPAGASRRYQGAVGVPCTPEQFAGGCTRLGCVVLACHAAHHAVQVGAKSTASTV